MPGFSINRNLFSEFFLFVLFYIPIFTFILPIFLAVITLSFPVSCFITGFVMFRRGHTEDNVINTTIPMFRQGDRTVDAHIAETSINTRIPIFRRGQAETHSTETGECVPAAATPHKTATRPPKEQEGPSGHHPYPVTNSAIRGGKRRVDILSPVAETDDPCNGVDVLSDSNDGMDEFTESDDDADYMDGLYESDDDIESWSTD